AWPVMRTGFRLPVVDGDAVERTRRVAVGEGHDGVIAHAAVEYVAEDYRGTSRRREGEAQSAALAGVVMRDARVRDGRAVIGRPRKGKRGADILFVPLARRHAIALVEPGGEQRAVGIERDRLEALAFLVGGDRTRRREAAATVGRARVKNLAVE